MSIRIEKKVMGRPKLDTHPITVRLSAEFIQMIDDARKKETDLPTRPEMMRRMMEDWFEKNAQD
ncbi:hypothetical protein [Loktanella sp. DSM 29012]|uniref:hypothetical protein n=1 Tax=Loktanella sp. DSM 29012 TaxID=1881056 RepID=UPI000B7CB01D|nr:hypothetical protein [Loktanella sp. DSM 29012]